MNIFLNNRLIILSSSFPENYSDSDRIAKYVSKDCLEKDFNEFEQNARMDRLILYSDDNYSSLEKDFFSLFKIIDAAGGVIFNKDGEKLFIFRYGKWDLPKGKMHKKEKPEEAALREVMEETGLQHPLITGKLPSTYHIYYLKSNRILKRTYWYSMNADTTEQLIPQTEEDISVVRWLGKKELKDVLSNTYASLVELINL